MVTWFICEIKLRFVLCKNMNLGVYYEVRFDDLKSTFDLSSFIIFYFQA